MMFFIVAAASASPTSPIRLRASGSDWSATGRAHAFALTHDDKAPAFTWAPQHPGRGARQSAYEIEVSDAAGRAVWRSGKVISGEPRCTFPLSAAPPLRTASTYRWHVTTFDGQDERSPAAHAAFHVAPAPIDWNKTSWLGSATSNMYRATFDAPAAAPVSSVLYVSGLGYSVVSLNGKPLNTLVTAPWTNNAHTVGFSSFDVTNALAANNTLTVALGNGWRDTKAFPVRDPADVKSQGVQWRMLRAMLVVTHADGSTKMLTHTGDGTWTAASGPSTFDSVYDGETYDARIADQLFQSSSSSAAALWSPAAIATGPAGRMVAWAVAPVQLLATIAPTNLTTPRPSLYVLDFGVRRAGVVRLSGLKCARGDVIVMRHAEILQVHEEPFLCPSDSSA